MENMRVAPNRKERPMVDFSDTGRRHLLRRPAAAEYLQAHYGFGTEKSLAKRASVGDGPPYIKALGRFALYDVAELDAWAQRQLSKQASKASAFNDEAA